MWPYDDVNMKLYITGADDPVAFGFSGFNDADRQRLISEVSMAEIEEALRTHGVYEHPTKAVRITRTREGL